MSISFLIPLSLSLVAVYIRYRIQEEIVVIFSTIMAAIALLLSFILAPWTVQLLILIAGLGACPKWNC